MRILPDSIDFDGAVDAHVEVFNQAIDQCFELYRTSAQQWNASVGALPIQAAETVELMDDLARGLLIKIFLAVVQAGQNLPKLPHDLVEAGQSEPCRVLSFAALPHRDSIVEVSYRQTRH